MTTIKKFSVVLSLLLALSLMPLAACSDQTQQASSSASTQAQTEQSSSSSESSAANIEVSVEIDATVAKDAGLDVSALDSIAGPASYQLAEDATAYDALVATGAELEGSPSYVTSIDGLAEGADGKTSGWMYEVNGEAPSVAANEFQLSSGDTVRWYFASFD